jgi:hypothetical protein
MMTQYPGLNETYATANAAYDELLEREDVDFHLAYIANLEATLTPLRPPYSRSTEVASRPCEGSCKTGAWEENRTPDLRITSAKKDRK